MLAKSSCISESGTTHLTLEWFGICFETCSSKKVVKMLKGQLRKRIDIRLDFVKMFMECLKKVIVFKFELLVQFWRKFNVFILIVLDNVVDVVNNLRSN